jgi:hypothetical protein
MVEEEFLPIRLALKAVLAGGAVSVVVVVVPLPISGPTTIQVQEAAALRSERRRRVP